jgi:hypothetical protein
MLRSGVGARMKPMSKRDRAYYKEVRAAVKAGGWVGITILKERCVRCDRHMVVLRGKDGGACGACPEAFVVEVIS